MRKNASTRDSVPPEGSGSVPDDDGPPTIRPPYDVEAFARSTTGPIDDSRPSQLPTGRPPVAGGAAPNSIEGALLEAVSSAAPVITESAIEDPVAEMRNLFAAANYEAALEIADLILADDPGHREAIECHKKCEAYLE